MTHKNGERLRLRLRWRRRRRLASESVNIHTHPMWNVWIYINIRSRFEKDRWSRDLILNVGANRLYLAFLCTFLPALYIYNQYVLYAWWWWVDITGTRESLSVNRRPFPLWLKQYAAAGGWNVCGCERWRYFGVLVRRMRYSCAHPLENVFSRLRCLRAFRFHFTLTFESVRAGSTWLGAGNREHHRHGKQTCTAISKSAVLCCAHKMMDPASQLINTRRKYIQNS